MINLHSLKVELEILENKITEKKDVTQAVGSLLSLTSQSRDFQYQFVHGGCRTGFRYFMAEIRKSCLRVLALHERIEEERTIIESEISKEMENLEKNLKQVISDLDHELSFSVQKPSIETMRGLDFLRAPLEGTKKYFVSYSHENGELALEIARRLFNLSLVSVWFDEIEIRRSDRIPEKINQGMKESTGGILLISDSYLSSRWCNSEWYSLFMKRLEDPNFKLYIVLVNNFDVSKLPDLLKPYRYTDCRAYPKPEAIVELGKLLEEIEHDALYSRFIR